MFFQRRRLGLHGLKYGLRGWSKQIYLASARLKTKNKGGGFDLQIFRPAGLEMGGRKFNSKPYSSKRPRANSRGANPAFILLEKIVDTSETRQLRIGHLGINRQTEALPSRFFP